MLLTVFSLLSYLVLIISAAPGYVQEKRPGYSSYYPGRKNVSPRSVAINPRYSHAIRTRNPHGGGGGHKHHYGGPPPILQTATTLINVHPTNGYRKCPSNGPSNQDDCSPPERNPGNKKVIGFQAHLPLDQPAPAYQPPSTPPPSPPPPVYQPSPPVYQPMPQPQPPRYIPPPQYAPPSTEAPYHRPGETVIRIGPKDEDYGKKKYKVLICKLQKD
ncbi:hypothetical protein CBL_03816 [Carabus blaptoides fortunei]